MLRRLEAIELSESFAKFIPAAWPVIEPGVDFHPSWFIDCIAEHLQAVSMGQILRLIINIPPRHGKSLTTSVFWPCWNWTFQPSDRYMFASYSGSLSLKHSVDRRSILNSPWYRARWGHMFDLSTDDNTKQRFSNTQHGHMIATSMTGSATGLGGNKLVLDDPINPEEAYSDLERKSANRQFDQTLSTRLDQPKTDAIVIIMQRLHEEDTTGHVLAKLSTNENLNQSDWIHLKLPTEADDKERIIFPLSGRVHEREAGELLNPARYDAKVVAAAKIDLGPVGYAGQHQQRPAALEGNIIKRLWIRFWVPADMRIPEPGTYAGMEVRHGITMRLPETFDRQVQSWDMTFKDTDGTDFVAGHVWASKDADFFLLDRDHERRDFPSTLGAVLRMTVKHPDTHAKFVEDKANGPAVIASLRHDVTGLIAVEPRGSKIARLYAASTSFASGNVYLPHPLVAPWVVSLINELCTIPNAAHDDDGDATSQALDQMLKANTSLQRWLAAEKKRKDEKAAMAAAGVKPAVPTNGHSKMPGGSLGEFLKRANK